MQIILAIIIGTLFGFVLHRVGASNPQRIIDMLRLKDFHLMKAILFGIAVASSILFVGMSFGIIESSHLSVKASYWGVIIGGLILGLGWAIGAYCPGTGVAALGDGRKDAIFFVLGGFVGALIYMLVFSSVKSSGLLESILGGKSTLALTQSSYPALIHTMPGIAVALVIAIIFGLIAWLLPKSAS
ncbi:MAG: hypothetical protein DHS20C13_03250 [Thermodesulfobacteriota bacterium]|nr:MAG: hypothetical protein DHS20C13_03250 [Thermodesulfobacteriota bacterium]